MASTKTTDVISVACPHTIKKFELISEYVKAWIEKLMNYDKCEGVVFIDCMSNSGIYKDSRGEEIEGTPVRVSQIIADAMHKYPQKQAYLYFNDLSQDKIELLEMRLPKKTENFNIHTDVMDGNELLRKISNQFNVYKNMNFLLLYDPYDAAIDWDAITPFFNNWGEVIINHMISDTLRAARVAKKPEAIQKYEHTYQMDIDELIAFGSDKKAFETVVESIIQRLSEKRQCNVAAFPFFNSNNALIYILIHCTGNIAGFRLFKKTAWKVFGDKSSLKNTHNQENQMQLLYDTTNGGYTISLPADDYCYYPRDIVRYIQRRFKGKKEVPLEEIWNLLDEHPVFPSDGYRLQIKSLLKNEYGDIVSRTTVSFSDRSN